MDGRDANLVSEDKNKGIFQKVLGLDYDYLVKFIVDEPHLGLPPSHHGAVLSLVCMAQHCLH